MVMLCVSSSRLTTSLAKLHMHMARRLPTRPIPQGIRSKNMRQMFLCVSYHLKRLRVIETLIGALSCGSMSALMLVHFLGGGPFEGVNAG